ncbi:hypothetical protein [Sinorhizobium glycinis]|uniref:hypothetical protein n=1 Tax=Sinorhizobium glycinis TaxID=1472378 RepID=UPI000B1B4048|nr:hypothetical protein [Sinorhizobium glycinis]
MTCLPGWPDGRPGSIAESQLRVPRNPVVVPWLFGFPVKNAAAIAEALLAEQQGAKAG